LEHPAVREKRVLGLTVDQAGAEHFRAIDVFTQRVEQVDVYRLRVLRLFDVRLDGLDLFVETLDDEGLNLFREAQKSRCSHPHSISCGGGLWQTGQGRVSFGVEE
jgi:hypothetical protein